MGTRFSVEPFDAVMRKDWRSQKSYLVVDFFGTEIFELELSNDTDWLSETDLDDVCEVAKQELGNLLKERLASRIIPLTYGGITIRENE